MKKYYFALNRKIDSVIDRINLTEIENQRIWDKLKSSSKNIGLDSTISTPTLNLNGINSKWKTETVRMKKSPNVYRTNTLYLRLGKFESKKREKISHVHNN